MYMNKNIRHVFPLRRRGISSAVIAHVYKISMSKFPRSPLGTPGTFWRPNTKKKGRLSFYDSRSYGSSSKYLRVDVSSGSYICSYI